MINLKTIRIAAHFSFIIFMMMLINDDGGDTGGLGSLSKVFGLLSFSLIILMLILGEKYRKNSYFHVFILWYFFWYFFSFVWGHTTDEATLENIKITVQALIMTIVLWQLLYDEKTMLGFYQAYIIAAMIVTIGMIDTFLNNPVIVSEGQEVRISFGKVDHNEIAVLLVIAIPMSLFIFTKTKYFFIKIFNLAYIPLCVAAIFLTASRTGLIILFLGLSYFVFILKKTSLGWKTVFISLFIISIIAVISLTPKSSMERMLSTGESISKGTLNERTVIWEKGLDEWKKQAIIGTGLNSFIHELNKHHVYLIAHNVYLTILVEQGIIGLILYLLVLCTLLFNILTLNGIHKPFLLIMMTIMLLAQFSLNLHTSILFWITYSFMFAHYSIYKNNTKILL